MAGTGMLEFAGEPDPVFLAIVGEALDLSRDLINDHDDEEYGHLYSGLAAVLSRAQAIDIIERLHAGLVDAGLLRLNDYHWLVMHEALEVLRDLHNDGALGSDGKIGPYVIDRIDLGLALDSYFFDLDFLLGSNLLLSEEHRPGFIDYTDTARKIATGLPPTAEEMELERIEQSQSDMEPAEPRDKPWPTGGYIGPYPLREPEVRSGFGRGVLQAASPIGNRETQGTIRAELSSGIDS
jgi:hypothetical protein